MLKDDARIKGIVNLVLRDQHGRVKQHKTIRNAVTDYGIAHIIGRLMDTGQDRRGLDSSKKHIIPRMMSHMGIGVGDPAQAAAANTSTVVGATQTNRFLQGELTDPSYSRVQVMKDTSLVSDYPSFSISVPATFLQSDGVTSVTTGTAGDNFFKMATGTGSGTSEVLRVGMAVDVDGANSGVFPTGTKIKQIVNDSTGVTTVSLEDSLGVDVTLQANIGSITIAFQYVDVIESSGHPYTSSSTPALAVSDYYARARGQVGGYYDVQNSPANAAANAQLAPFFGEFDDRPSTDFEQFGTDVDGVFQGTRVGSSIVEDAGTQNEGYRTDENDFNVTSTPTYPLPQNQAPDAQRGKKKMGDRIVFVATFKENNPSATTLVREAGIFNSPDPHTTFDGTTNYATAGLTGTDAGYNAANADGPSIAAVGGGAVNLWKAGSPRAGDLDQTMLCRTTFDVVTKAPLDTLQITWSVQLSDQT